MTISALASTPPSPAASPEDVRFQVNGLTLAARLWGPEDGIPTIALHGWLDNANSHNRLLPLLPELRVCALDFAGHGASDHRPTGVPYTSSANVQDVLAVANALGWQQFHLIGHSMGAAVATEFAGLFPDRLLRTVMIDGFLVPRAAAELVAQQRQALEQMVAPARSAPLYPDTRAMAERVAAATDQSLAAASELVARGHRVAGDQVTWCTDPRIRYSTPDRLTTEGVQALMANSSAPALLLVAADGDGWYRPGIAERQAEHPALTVLELAGPHHLHLEPDHAAAVASAIRAFLKLD